MHLSLSFTPGDHSVPGSHLTDPRSDVSHGCSGKCYINPVLFPRDHQKPKRKASLLFCPSTACNTQTPRWNQSPLSSLVELLVSFSRGTILEVGVCFSESLGRTEPLLPKAETYIMPCLPQCSSPPACWGCFPKQSISNLWE